MIPLGQMEKKIRENAVYISLLPDDVTEAQIQEMFGSIGVIKVGLVLKKKFFLFFFFYLNH